MSNRTSLLLLHAIVLVFGFTGILGKEISLGAVQIVFFRMLIAYTGLIAFQLIRGKIQRIQWRKIRAIGAVGLVVAAHWITFFEAIKQSNVSVALTTMATTSLFIAFIEPLVKKRRIDPLEVILGLLVIIGLVMIFQVDSSYHLGIVLGLCSAFLAALFGTLNSIFITNTSSLRISTIEMFTGCVGVALYLIVSGQWSVDLFRLGAYDLGLLLILGLIATALAFVGAVEVMKQLSPFTVSLTINLEPIYSIILALLLYPEDEVMTVGFYLGAGIIISTLFLNSFVRRRRKKKKALI